MPTKKLTREDILLPWAFGEVTNPRWREKFLPHFGEELYGKIAKVNSPKKLRRRDRAMLLKQFIILRKKLLDEYFFPSKYFKIIDYPVEMLENIIVMTSMGWRDHPVTIAEYMRGEYSKNFVNDPRVAAELKDHNTKIKCKIYPILAYDQALKTTVLIDGYSRVISLIHKYRNGEKLKPVKMIFCGRWV